MIPIDVDALLAKAKTESQFSGVTGVTPSTTLSNHAGVHPVAVVTPVTPGHPPRCDNGNEPQAVEIASLHTFVTPVTPVTPQKEHAALAFLLDLHARGVILTPSPDGTVRCRAPKGTLTPALVDGMRQHKAALHDLVEAVEERAAIAEFEAGVPRAEAEALAWQCVLGEGEKQP